MSISLVAGLPAKEIVVSTMGVLYQSSADESTVNLQHKLQNEIHTSGILQGEKVFTLPASLAFLVFILLYFPCVGVVATIKNEAGSWKWAAFVVFYTTSLAWFVAFLVYNGVNLIL
jgi:ferrous iron transport protein B